jgi:hypothetical protein
MSLIGEYCASDARVAIPEAKLNGWHHKQAQMTVVSALLCILAHASCASFVPAICSAIPQPRIILPLCINRDNIIKNSRCFLMALNLLVEPRERHA